MTCYLIIALTNECSFNSDAFSSFISSCPNGVLELNVDVLHLVMRALHSSFSKDVLDEFTFNDHYVLITISDLNKSIPLDLI